MNAEFTLLFLVIGFFCFGLAATKKFESWPVNLVALGLASWIFVSVYAAMRAI